MNERSNSPRYARGSSQQTGPGAGASAVRRPAVSGQLHQTGAIPGQAPALWQQLSHVAQALQSIREGQSSRAVLQQVPEQLRPGVQALLFQALRQLGRAQALLRELAPRNPPPRVSALLCAALALAWDEQAAPYPPFTLVNQAVEAAKRGYAPAQSGFVNACLRRFLREREALVQATDKVPEALWNHPTWWIKRLQADYPEHWQTILQANNQQPPMTLRVNKKKVLPEQYLNELLAIDMGAKRVLEAGLQLEHAVPVHDLPGFAQGLASVQDAAAQWATPLLLGDAAWPVDRPLRVLDACAAPGGKTAHLLEFAGDRAIEVTALEIDPVRAERIGQTLARLGLQAKVVIADAGQPKSWFAQHCANEPFDFILLDAPCSASGIVRRQPDARWLRRESDIAQLAAIQARLLDTLWPLLAPGGRMLYCTCSVFKAEGQSQVQAFVARNSTAETLPAPGHLLPGFAAKEQGLADNGLSDHDGFFYALLRKPNECQDN